MGKIWFKSGGIAGICAASVAVCLAQPPNQRLSSALEIPPIKASVTIGQQPVEIALWGSMLPGSGGMFALNLTADLGGLQEHLTPILSAQLDKSDRCGDRISVEQATISPAGLLTANLNFERFACVKALGKRIAKRLVGGHAAIVVTLTPSVEEGDISIEAEVKKIEADGSLGEILHSGSLGDSIREKIAAGVQSSIQKLTDLKSRLPAEMAQTVSVDGVQFADDGSGRLRLTISAEVELSLDQLRAVTKELGR